jgi:hypothetical protein
VLPTLPQEPATSGPDPECWQVAYGLVELCVVVKEVLSSCRVVLIELFECSCQSLPVILQFLGLLARLPSRGVSALPRLAVSM